ncbi:MAG: hypothetical protein LBK47_01530 [Prevotellaceae bacterium]|jgi:hypothetical protein|nr:hypothetical protein [Prevotellaceae bacterium]
MKTLRNALIPVIAVLALLLPLQVMAQDDFYYNPKKEKQRREQQVQQASPQVQSLLKRTNDAVQATPVDNNDDGSYVEESWGNLDSIDQGYANIYEISRKYPSDNQNYSDNDDRPSYERSIVFDDPTYSITTRDYWGAGYPYWPYSGTYGYYGSNGWSIGIGWNYPYYYRYNGWYGWNYPHWGGGGWYSPYHYHYSGYYYPYYYSKPRNVTHYQRTNSMSGTSGGTGYTSGRGTTGGQRSGSSKTTLTVPNVSYRPVRGSNSNATSYTRPGTTGANPPATTTPPNITYREVRGRDNTQTQQVQYNSNTNTSKPGANVESSRSSSSGNASQSSGGRTTSTSGGGRRSSGR